MHGTMGRRPGAILAALVAGASLVAGLGVAAAHTNKIVTTNEIHSSGPEGIGGHLESGNSKCLRRRVNLYKMSSGESHLFASKMSDEEGVYQFPGSLPSGRFYTAAKRKQLAASGEHDHVCVRAESTKVLIGDAG